MERLNKLFVQHFGCLPVTVVQITGSGSSRCYYRLQNGLCSAIGCIGTDIKENQTFIRLDKVLWAVGAKVPELYGLSPDGMAYLQEDMGDESLFSVLDKDDAPRLVTEAMEALVEVQLCDSITEDMLYPVRRMTEQHSMYDLNYFKYCFLKPAGVVMDEDQLQVDFQNITEAVCRAEYQGNMYRDFQSRNVMIKDGSPWLIDFQSMRKGPLLYDVASFLWQARARFSSTFRKEMAEVYFRILCQKKGLGDISFPKHELEVMVLFRTLQVLGAYGLRGLTERKSHFIESIPAALDNVSELIQSGALDRFPELKRCLEQCVESPRFQPVKYENKLLVTVFSFSYKLGYPEDLSGNGGGFMFDCRALHNPGRYDLYKPMTGRDKPVIDFLEERGEVQLFLNAVYQLTDQAVDRYIKRGFSSLQIGFGCTGGRHRSVYSAEHTARHIADKFGDNVVVRLIHREQKIDEIIS